MGAIKIHSRKCNSFIKGKNWEKAKVKLRNSQLEKLNSWAENKTGTTLRITKKIFQNEEFPHTLFLTTRQKTK